MTHWRDILARLPLPMLALSAAYGVWQFQILFTPWYVALLSAAAFEIVYVALAFSDTHDRQRAAVISVAAVTVSVLYNTLSSLFAIRPELLQARPLWSDIALATLHGLPLAVVAYAVADLLLHRSSATPVQAERDASAAPVVTVQNAIVVHQTERPALSRSQQVKQLAVQHGVSETTIWRRVKQGTLQLESEE